MHLISFLYLSKATESILHHSSPVLTCHIRAHIIVNSAHQSNAASIQNVVISALQAQAHVQSASVIAMLLAASAHKVHAWSPPEPRPTGVAEVAVARPAAYVVVASLLDVGLCVCRDGRHGDASMW